MAGKARVQPGRNTRSVSKRGAKSHRQVSRNITRWSANKDIALLCALAKECRKDKFRIGWDRVAKWIGPNVTGGAIEQHVAKLYSKLKEHRASREPKRKKRKSHSAEEDEPDADYVDDEEIWNKGNEAFANIFYDKPDASTMILDDDDTGAYDDINDHHLRHKNTAVSYEDEDEYEEEELGSVGPQYSSDQYLHTNLAPIQGYGRGIQGQQYIKNEYSSNDNQEESLETALVPYGYGRSSTGEGSLGYGNSYNQQQQEVDRFGTPISMTTRDASATPAPGLYQYQHPSGQLQYQSSSNAPYLQNPGGFQPTVLAMRSNENQPIGRMSSANRMNNAKQLGGPPTQSPLPGTMTPGQLHQGQMAYPFPTGSNVHPHMRPGNVGAYDQMRQQQQAGMLRSSGGQLQVPSGSPQSFNAAHISPLSPSPQASDKIKKEPDTETGRSMGYTEHGNSSTQAQTPANNRSQAPNLTAAPAYTEGGHIGNYYDTAAQSSAYQNAGRRPVNWGHTTANHHSYDAPHPETTEDRGLLATSETDDLLAQWTHEHDNLARDHSAEQ